MGAAERRRSRARDLLRARRGRYFRKVSVRHSSTATSSSPLTTAVTGSSPPAVTVTWFPCRVQVPFVVSVLLLAFLPWVVRVVTAKLNVPS